MVRVSLLGLLHWLTLHSYLHLAFYLIFGLLVLSLGWIASPWRGQGWLLCQLISAQCRLCGGCSTMCINGMTEPTLGFFSSQVLKSWCPECPCSGLWGRRGPKGKLIVFLIPLWMLLSIEPALSTHLMLCLPAATMQKTQPRDPVVSSMGKGRRSSSAHGHRIDMSHYGQLHGYDA